MKRKVRIYKAQMGGVQAMQNTAAQAQPSDEDLMNSAVSMIQQGATAEETLQALIDAGVQQEKATQIVSGLISYIGDQRDQEVASYEDDQTALEDLDATLKKSQNELIKTIVKSALFVIMSVGFITTIMYSFAILSNKDTQIIGSTWSNMFSVLLTNAFSIVGTIMGIKYATSDDKK